MNQELSGLLERGQHAAKALGLEPNEAVQGYAYEDGRVVMRMRVPLKPGQSGHARLLDLEEALLLPEGVYLEGNFLMDPNELFTKKRKQLRLPGYGAGGRDKTPKGYFPRFKGLERLQMWGSQRPAYAWDAMREILVNLKKKGFRQPEQIYIRVGKTIDGSQPFYRQRPPTGGTRVRKNKPRRGY